ncbi:MAG: ABC transporter permease [Candidatus Aminicenantes bacterium]|nr:ABC transporter permease [Candidatus Aminicenantes bacterium]
MENQDSKFSELYFSFKGRIPRSTFWLNGILVLNAVMYTVVLAGFLIYSGIGALVNSGLKENTGTILQILTVLITLIAYIIVLIPFFALSVKRCHDRNRSGWFVLISLIPVIGSIWYSIETGFLSGTKGKNRFGMDPLQIDQEIKPSSSLEQIDPKTVSSTQKHVAYKICTIVALAAGISLCVLCLTYLQNELSYDRYNEKADQIYRIVVNTRFNFDERMMQVTPAPAAETLLSEFSKVLNATRLNIGSNKGKVSIQSENKQFIEDRFLLCDSNFFDFFSIPLIKGDPKTAFASPNSVVITRATADKYFGDKDPMGKGLIFRDHPEYRITGVSENVPPNSHFSFDFLAFRMLDPKQAQNWSNHYFFTYVMLPEDYSPKQLEKKFPDFLKKYIPSQFQTTNAHYEYYLQPLTDIHLHSPTKTGLKDYGELTHIYIFAGAAFLILLLTCLNYINLATTRLIDKTRDSGIYKISGLIRSQLFKKLGVETFLWSLISLVAAVVFTRLLWPIFESFFIAEMEISLLSNILFSGLVWVAVLIFVFVTGYLIIFLFSYHIPALVLKNSLHIVQFIIAMFLIINTTLIYKQLNFMHKKNLEFGTENVLVIPLGGEEINSDPLKAELLQHPAILSMTASSRFWSPSFSVWAQLEGIPSKEILTDILAVDYDFLKTLSLDLVAGRDFSKEIRTDESEALIINETAAREIMMDSPIGKRLSTFYGPLKKGRVIGVFRDYHFNSLHQSIKPIVIHINRSRYSHLMIKISPDDADGTISFIEGKFKQFAPDLPFEYSFLEENYKNMYEKDEKQGQLFRFALFCTIFFTFFSIYGLLAYLIGYYRRQKLLKPSIINIALSFPVVCYASLIAWPAAYLFMKKWLEIYAYRVDIGIWPFILATLSLFTISVLVTLIAGVYHALTTRIVKSN